MKYCPKCGRPLHKSRHCQSCEPEKTSPETSSMIAGAFVLISILALAVYAIFIRDSSPQPTTAPNQPLPSRMIKEEDYAEFQEIIANSGYICRTCEGGHILGEGSRGMNFRVYCNDNQQRYFVIIGQAGTTCVEPWDKKGTKCEE